MIHALLIWEPIALMIGWVWSGSMRRGYVPGTYGRYKFNTLEKIFRFPASMSYVLNIPLRYALGYFADGGKSGSDFATMLVTAAMSMAWCIYFNRKFRRDDRDDDDDWFKKTGKRLRRWVRNNMKMQSPIAVLGGASFDGSAR